MQALRSAIETRSFAARTREIIEARQSLHSALL
jgi:hypothetical protein